jgi:hypothetical protein
MSLVVLAGCSKKHEGAAAKQEPATAAAPTDPAAAAKEAARAEGVLGHTTNQFGDPGDLQAKGGGEGNGKAQAQPVVGGATPVGTLTFGKVVLPNKTDGAPITAALTKRLDELQACYQDALGTTPALAGALTLAFTLKPDGSFDAIAVASSTLKDESLETCLIDSMKSAKVAKPIGKAPLKGSISLDFHP